MMGVPSLLLAATNPPSQLFTLTALPVEITGASELPRRVFAGPAHYVIESVLPNSSFGGRIAIGDFNGDGRPELAVGVSRFKVGGRQVGKVGIFSFPSPGAVPRLDSQWQGGLSSRRSGAELETGDVNGDGSTDLLVGVAYVSAAQQHVGMVKLFTGGRTGLLWEPAWDNLGTDSSGPKQKMLVADMNRDGVADVVIASASIDKASSRGGGVWLFAGSTNGLSRQPMWSAHPGVEDSMFGAALLAADVNGDGWPDLLVGAPQDGNGTVSIFCGSPGGLPKKRAQVLTGRAADSAYGSALARVGDLNGNGCIDVVVGAPGVEKKRDWPGEAYLLHGSRTGLVQSTGWRAVGWRAGAAFGDSVAGVGDVNGDGRPDLLIGAPGQPRENTMPGRVSLWLGRSDGFSPAPDWEVTADVNYTRLGGVVTGAGDLDGDGLNDFVVTSHNQTAHGTTVRVGRVDVFRGLRRGYGAGEQFPADGVVCMGADHTDETRKAKAREMLVSATNSVAASARAQAQTVRQTRGRMSVIGGISFVLAVAAVWLWLNRRHVRSETARLERERIARDLHDGLGSSMHRLQRLTELLNQVETTSPRAQRYRDELIRTAQELGGSMDLTIWAVQPENDTLENLVSYLAGYAPSVLQPNGIDCELDLPATLPPRRLHGDMRQQLLLAVNEALNNVVKHSRAEHAWLRVAWREPWLQIVVEDDGCGLPDDGSGQRDAGGTLGAAAARPGGGNGLKNLRERLAALGGECLVSACKAGGVCVAMRLHIGAVAAG